MWLRSKINAALLLCIGAPLALGFAAIWYGAQTTMREAGTREIAVSAAAAAAALEDRIANNLAGLLLWSKLSVMQDVLIADESGELARTLNSIAANARDVATLAVTDAQGTVIAGTGGVLPGASLAGDEGFHAAVSGRIHQSAIGRHGASLKDTLSFAVPIVARHDGQTIIGTVHATLDVSALAKTAAAPMMVNAGGNAFALVKRSGQIVYASRTDAVLLQLFRDARNATELTAGGEPFFAAAATLKKKTLPQDPSLSIVAITPARAILATTDTLATTFLIVASIAVAAAFLLAWHWTTPLVELGKAMEALAGGNVLYRGPKTKPADAFAPMARAFEVLRQMRVVRDKLGARERDLAQAKNAAESALKAKSEHLASLSHALSAQLSTIVRLSDLINRETLEAAKGETRSSYAKEIARTGAALLAVINDLFDLSEVEAGHVALAETDTDLTQLVRETCEQLQPLAFEAQVTLGRNGVDQPLFARCDAKKLGQALTHLVQNAVKFTPAGGLVTVHLRLNANDCPVIAVEDTGIGMSPNLAPAAATLDDPQAPGHHGAGLGLPLARELVELHQGTLEIESEQGEGTLVTITLPAERLIPTAEDRKIA
jgi:signal transduction histidine kinase